MLVCLREYFRHIVLRSKQFRLIFLLFLKLNVFLPLKLLSLYFGKLLKFCCQSLYPVFFLLIWDFRLFQLFFKFLSFRFSLKCFQLNLLDLLVFLLKYFLLLFSSLLFFLNSFLQIYEFFGFSSLLLFLRRSWLFTFRLTYRLFELVNLMLKIHSFFFIITDLTLKVFNELLRGFYFLWFIGEVGFQLLDLFVSFFKHRTSLLSLRLNWGSWILKGVNLTLKSLHLGFVFLQGLCSSF